MLDTVPSGVQLTKVITPLPVKPVDLLFILDGDTLQFSGTVRFWNMTEDPDRIVRLLWDDHLGGTSNITLGAGFTVAEQQAQRYSFPALSLDAIAGITSLRFTVDGKLEDQGGLGFPVQDDVVMSASSCFNGFDTLNEGKLHIAVRTGVSPTRVYLETEERDTIDRPIVVEIDVMPPSQPPPANTSYSMWNLELSANQRFTSFTVGAEINGVKGTRSGPYARFNFAPCADAAGV
ncbi:hypothetical protein MVEN_02233300 [Mycena venus]|uniref:Uncharacterized protein n=1 Tax=Mycena venus TaxID=2733690 RepID=A0A8H6X7R4_9AGAR|nr:hypothetical protein MVEN_02233300 [Mycena venus]